jgi:hypothetical protein
MLVLDGYQMIGDNEYLELNDFLTKYLPLEAYVPWMVKIPAQAGLAMLCNQLGEFPYRMVKINRLFWPTGACRFGFIHLLCDSDTVGLIGNDAYNEDGSYNLIQLSIGNPETNVNPGTGIGTIFAGESINTSVYLLPPTPLSGIRGLTGQINSLYLLTCVDPRYFWWFKNVGDIASFMDSSTTWQNMFDYVLANQLGLSISNYTIDTISPAYLQPSLLMYSLPYEPIPPILDSLCYNVGMRFVANFDGTYATQVYGTALDVLNNDMVNNPNRSVLSGGQRFASPL